MDVTSVRHPFSDYYIGLRNRYSYQQHQHRAVLAWGREHLRNAFEYGAKNAELFSIFEDDKHYVVMIHDGTPFHSVEKMKQAMLPAHSVGQNGYQGMGSKLSSLFLCNHLKDSEHYFMTWKDDGSKFCCRSTVQDHYSEVAECPEFLSRLEKYIVGSEFPVHVAYVSRYQSKSRTKRQAFQDLTTCNQLTDYARSAFGENGLRFIYNSGFVLNQSESEGQLIVNLKQLHDQSVKGYYRKVEAVKREDYRDLFCPKDCQFTFPFQQVVTKVSGRDQWLHIDGNLHIDLYPGGLRERNCTDSQGLIPLGESTAKHACGVARFSSSMVMNCFPKSKADRLASDPVYFGEQIETVATALGCTLGSKHVDFYDLEDFPEYYGDVDMGTASKAHRRPFARIELEITSARVSSHKKAVSNSSFLKLHESEVRDSLGGLDPMFNTMHNHSVHTIFRDVSDDIAQKHDLRLLQTKVRELFPYQTNDMADHLDINFSDKQLPRVKFVGEKYGTNQMPVDVFDRGNFVYETGDLKGVRIDPDEKINFDDLDEAGFFLRHQNGDQWTLSYAPLQVRDSLDEEFRPATDDEWREKSRAQAIGLYQPYTQARSIRINGQRYKFLNRPSGLPKVLDKGVRGKKGEPEQGEGGSKSLLEGGPFNSYGDNPLYFVRPDKTQYWMNRDNPRVIQMFRKLPQFKKIQSDWWDEIRREIDRVMDFLVPLNLGHLDQSHPSIRNFNWGDDGTREINYIVNHAIYRFFHNPSVDKHVREMEKFVTDE